MGAGLIVFIFKRHIDYIVIDACGEKEERHIKEKGQKKEGNFPKSKGDNFHKLISTIELL
jgi:hypothetical protein